MKKKREVRPDLPDALPQKPTHTHNDNGMIIVARIYKTVGDGLTTRAGCDQKPFKQNIFLVKYIS